MAAEVGRRYAFRSHGLYTDAPGAPAATGVVTRVELGAALVEWDGVENRWGGPERSFVPLAAFGDVVLQAEPLPTPEEQQARDALYEGMVRASNDYYSASWLMDLEFVLWHQLHDPPAASWRVPDDAAQRLRDLARAAGGWFTWPESADEPRFVPTETWTRLFAEERRHRREGHHPSVVERP